MYDDGICDGGRRELDVLGGCRLLRFGESVERRERERGNLRWMNRFQ